MEDDRVAEMRRLVYEEKWTYQEVGEAYNLTKQRVHSLLHPPTHGKRKPGRPKGSKNATRVRRLGSWPTKLEALEVGESLWVPTTLESRWRDMTKAIPHGKRLVPPIDSMHFETALYTAVGAKDAGNIRYLIEVKRTK